MTIKSNDRVFICGKTGSGKTVLGKILTSNISRLVVLDGKGSLDKWGLSDWNDDTKRKLAKLEDVRVRIVYNNPEVEPSDFWEDALKRVFESGYCTIYIDEIYVIVPPGTKPSSFLWAIWTMGREKQIGGWAATQRPSFIPLFFISEAEYYFMFRLMLEDDRKRMAGFMTSQVLEPIKDKHGFYYMNAEDDTPIYTKKLNLK